MIRTKQTTALMGIISGFLISFSVFAATDASLTSMVNDKLKSDKTTAASSINVSTKDGVVSLSGNVNTEAEASAAIQSANSVSGVSDVDSDMLTVNNSSQPYKDSYITSKVKGVFMREKLFGDKPIAVMSITVETKDSTVYLTGTADSKAQIDTATMLAKKVKGVANVDSKVVVK